MCVSPRAGVSRSTKNDARRTKDKCAHHGDVMHVALRKLTTAEFVVSLWFDGASGLPRAGEVMWLPNGLGWKVVRVDRSINASGAQEFVTLIVEKFEI